MKNFFKIAEEKKSTENQQLFDGIIDVTLFDGVEGLLREGIPLLL